MTSQMSSCHGDINDFQICVMNQFDMLISPDGDQYASVRELLR